MQKLRSAVLLATFVISAAIAAPPNWIVTWGASPAPQLADAAEMRAAKLQFENQTIREIVHTSVASDTVRVRLSNAYGRDAVQIGAAHIAIRDKGSNVVAGSDRTLTFSGRPMVTIPTDAPILSDPVKLNVPADGDLAISIFLPKAATGAGIHYSAQQTSYIGKGDLTAAPSFTDAATITSWVFLTSVDVTAPDSGSTLVAFGDSITDGARSTVDANRRWPNFVAQRLLAQKGGSKIGVLDAGIGGNRILHDPADNIRFG